MLCCFVLSLFDSLCHFHKLLSLFSPLFMVGSLFHLSIHCLSLFSEQQEQFVAMLKQREEEMFQSASLSGSGVLVLSLRFFAFHHTLSLPLPPPIQFSLSLLRPCCSTEKRNDSSNLTCLFSRLSLYFSSPFLSFSVLHFFPLFLPLFSRSLASVLLLFTHAVSRWCTSFSLFSSPLSCLFLFRRLLYFSMSQNQAAHLGNRFPSSLLFSPPFSCHSSLFAFCVLPSCFFVPQALPLRCRWASGSTSLFQSSFLFFLCFSRLVRSSSLSLLYPPIQTIASHSSWLSMSKRLIFFFSYSCHPFLLSSLIITSIISSRFSFSSVFFSLSPLLSIQGKASHSLALIGEPALIFLLSFENRRNPLEENPNTTSFFLLISPSSRLSLMSSLWLSSHHHHHHHFLSSHSVKSKLFVSASLTSRPLIFIISFLVSCSFLFSCHLFLMSSHFLFFSLFSSSFLFFLFRQKQAIRQRLIDEQAAHLRDLSLDEAARLSAQEKALAAKQQMEEEKKQGTRERKEEEEGQRNQLKDTDTGNKGKTERVTVSEGNQEKTEWSPSYFSLVPSAFSFFGFVCHLFFLLLFVFLFSLCVVCLFFSLLAKQFALAQSCWDHQVQMMKQQDGEKAHKKQEAVESRLYWKKRGEEIKEEEKKEKEKVRQKNEEFAAFQRNQIVWLLFSLNSWFSPFYFVLLVMSGEQERERREPKLQQKKERKEKSLHYHHNIVGLCFSLSSFLQAERQADVMREIEADHQKNWRCYKRQKNKRSDYKLCSRQREMIIEQKENHWMHCCNKKMLGKDRQS